MLIILYIHGIITFLKNLKCGKLFKKIPDEFSNFIKYSKSLKIGQETHYSYLISLLNNVLFIKNLIIKL